MSKRQEQINYGLFDNPSVRNLLKTMSPEDIEKYKKIGEEFYGQIDFEKSEVLANLAPPMAEALAYIKEGIKSGLLPVDFEENEINLLREVYGDEWYKAFNFTEDDVKFLNEVNEVKEVNDITSTKN